MFTFNSLQLQYIITKRLAFRPTTTVLKWDYIYYFLIIINIEKNYRPVDNAKEEIDRCISYPGQHHDSIGVVHFTIDTEGQSWNLVYFFPAVDAFLAAGVVVWELVVKAMDNTSTTTTTTTTPSVGDCCGDVAFSSHSV